VIKIKFNVLLGLLLTLAIVSIIVSNYPNSISIKQTNSQQFSPQKELNKLDTNVGLLHYSCSNTCWENDRCQKSESFQGVNKNYYCICSECETTEKCILSSNERNNFVWNC